MAERRFDSLPIGTRVEQHVSWPQWMTGPFVVVAQNGEGAVRCKLADTRDEITFDVPGGLVGIVDDATP